MLIAASKCEAPRRCSPVEVSLPPSLSTDDSNQQPAVVMRQPAEHPSEAENKETFIPSTADPAVGPWALPLPVRPTTMVPSVLGLGSVPNDDKGELTAPGVSGVSFQVTAEHGRSLSLATGAIGSTRHRVLVEVSPLEDCCPVVRVDQYPPTIIQVKRKVSTSMTSSAAITELSVSPCTPTQMVPGLGSNAPEFQDSEWTAPEVPGTGPKTAEVGTDSVPEDLLATMNHHSGKVSTLYPLQDVTMTLSTGTLLIARFPVEASQVRRDKDCVVSDTVKFASFKPKKERSIHHVVDRGKGQDLLAYRIHAADGLAKRHCAIPSTTGRNQYGTSDCCTRP
ncbi:uncharacterized protein LOC142487141 [Ascaphus truei]|uniref:uncharacterized protein LOC142487141 n=1 Tax=Ascaphus truei TaxID=8439 RepID=UPI003F5AD949